MAKKGTKKRKKGSMSGMRSGFKGIVRRGKKGTKSDPKQFMTMLIVMFAIFALVFFVSR